MVLMVDELVQSTAMEWILTFLEFAQNTVVAFTPRIVPAILPNLASPQYVQPRSRADLSRHIKLAAHETNGSLYRVIQSLSLQIQHPTPSQTVPSPNAPLSTSPINAPRRENEVDPLKDPLSTEADSKAITSSASASNVGSIRTKPSAAVPASEPVTPIQFEFPAGIRASSPNAQTGTPRSTVAETVSDDDAFDVRETVNVLTLQFLSDHAETRIAALEWLLMLHLKAPQKVSLFVGSC
jgi:vacuole morphology and inheritance protein 14